MNEKEGMATTIIHSGKNALSNLTWRSQVIQFVCLPICAVSLTTLKAKSEIKRFRVNTYRDKIQTK